MSNIQTQDGYNLFDEFADYSYELIKYMIDNNELIFKLLKYQTPDAWKDSKPNLTKSEKGALIYNGIGDASNYSIFLENGNPDVAMNESSFLTISPYFINGENRSISNITIMMEIYVNFKIVHLSNYKSRVDMIARELLKTFNGVAIDGLGIGKLYFDKLGYSGGSSSERSGQLPFKGRTILFTSNVGA